jgi:hypothetical protein
MIQQRQRGRGGGGGASSSVDSAAKGYNKPESCPIELEPMPADAGSCHLCRMYAGRARCAPRRSIDQPMKSGVAVAGEGNSAAVRRPYGTSELACQSRDRLKDLEREESRAEARQRDLAQGVGVFRPGGARPPRQVMVRFVDEHREEYWVEPICAVLQVAPSARSETRTTTRSPRPSSGFSKQRSSDDEDHGAASTPSSTRRSNGWTARRRPTRARSLPAACVMLQVACAMLQVAGHARARCRLAVRRLRGRLQLRPEPSPSTASATAGATTAPASSATTTRPNRSPAAPSWLTSWRIDGRRGRR